MIKLTVAPDAVKRLVDEQCHLSCREIQVLLGIASGLPLAEAADNLHISIKTASTYRGRALEKLDLKSNADAVAFCISKGYLVVEDMGESLEMKAMKMVARGFTVIGKVRDVAKLVDTQNKKKEKLLA